MMRMLGMVKCVRTEMDGYGEVRVWCGGERLDVWEIEIVVDIPPS